MSAEENLKRLGLELPPAPVPGGKYLPFRRVGNLVYLAGVISVSEAAGEWTGQVGDERTLEDGRAAARVCGLNALAVLRSVTGSLDDVKQVVNVSGYVNAVAAYGQSPSVINGASELFVEVFGGAGEHARAAVSVAGLPKNATVEIQVVAEMMD
ncbi:MAG: RidA family protein [Verrucomicrobia bacterium]|nr:RidA family protein [Verrucomicrobiota bacterium]MCH8528269.1 RidA family protein [Kiritimatiellia bacterium]